MELREYWDILRRRWWIPVSLMLIVGVLSFLQTRPWSERLSSWSASERLLVGVMPAAGADVAAYDPRYYGWLTSEYLVDDFTEVVRSGLFAQNVSQRLEAENVQLPPGVIQGSAATGKLHRIITLSFKWPDQEGATAIAQAAAEELTENASEYFEQLGTQGAGVTLIDGPTISEVGPSTRDRLQLPLRMLLAFLVGVGLVFLLEYLDTSVRDEKGLEELGLSPLGRIPKS
jgi:capsular polysaccharide biosynthesis protein